MQCVVIIIKYSFEASLKHVLIKIYKVCRYIRKVSNVNIVQSRDVSSRTYKSKLKADPSFVMVTK